MKRPTCHRCERPESACICSWVSPTENVHEVLILQHPSEVAQAKGSATLLRLSLSNCQLHIGEHFDDERLEALLFAPWANSVGRAQPVLLYPGAQNSFAANAAVNPRLVVLDTTWRKSRKMLYLNPRLAQLPRMNLENIEPSRYLVRKAHQPEQRSTLEAVCTALKRLEIGREAQYESILEGFDGFVQALAARANR